MNPKVQLLAKQTNVAIAVILSLWGIFMVTMPFHPFAGDSHRGLTGVIPGLLLLTLALLTYLVGRILRRLPGWGGIAEAVVPAIVLAVAMSLAFG